MKRKSEPSDFLCSQDALSQHAAHCHSAVGTSAFKPTWELLPRPYFLHMHEPCVPAGPLPPVRAFGPRSLPVPRYITPAAVQAFQRVRSGNDKAWEASLEARLVAAIRKWQGIISQAPLEFDLGRRVSKDRPLGDTLPEGLPFPLRESLVFSFCTGMEKACSAPTFLHSFLTTLRFAHYVLGLLGALECASSSRVAGVARLMFLTKKKKRQRPALTAKMVAALEKLAADPDASSLDRVIAGFFVLLVYTRGRFSDGLNMQNLRTEVPASASANSLAGYVEADVSRTKAAYTLERKTMYLPIVAPRHGVTDHDWFSGFLEARQASCVPSGPGIPLLPARSSSSGWSTVPPTAGVAASWLRGTLQSLGFAARDISPIGTHSCKTTTLSWASKAGLSTATRRALGSHSASDDKMVLVYSRDAMSAPVRELESVIKDVREGRFRPDETRSGFFRSDEELEESGTESSCNEEDDVEDQANLDEAIDLYVQPWSEVDGAGQAGAPVARHKVSRMIHAIADEAGDRSRCGKALNANYATLPVAPNFMYPLCRKCYP